MNKKQLGADGEKIAVRFLETGGYKILEKNYASKIGEIDIVAQIGETIVFVEVKTRTAEKYGLPRESVNFHKQRKYSLLAAQYLLKKGMTESAARFDVVDILGGKVTHIVNAFDYTGY